MVLENCRYCSEQIHEGTIRCPHCRQTLISALDKPSEEIEYLQTDLYNSSSITLREAYRALSPSTKNRIATTDYPSDEAKIIAIFKAYEHELSRGSQEISDDERITAVRKPEKIRVRWGVVLLIILYILLWLWFQTAPT